DSLSHKRMYHNAIV
ncbi:hypothetical protein ECPA45_5818, partial [Escherichia coli PA45]